MPSKITTCLWFNGRAEEAASFYVSVFPDSRITQIQPWGEGSVDIHGHKPGSAMVVAFELLGQSFIASNVGTQYPFPEAISFDIDCADQEEVDSYWEKLADGGNPEKQRCGWVSDKFGISWRVVPRVFADMMSDPDPEKVTRAFRAMSGMKKLEIAALKSAYEG